jgi:hypothetical protein
MLRGCPGVADGSSSSQQRHARRPRTLLNPLDGFTDEVTSTAVEGGPTVEGSTEGSPLTPDASDGPLDDARTDADAAPSRYATAVLSDKVALRRRRRPTRRRSDCTSTG